MIIGMCGAAGTGKSTLVEEIIKLDGFKNYKRYTNTQRILHNYLGDKFPHSSETNDISQVSITSNFVMQLLEGGDIIADRTLIDTFAYAATSKGVTLLNEIENSFSKALELYDIIFYTPIEFTIEGDGFRNIDVDYNKRVQEKILYYLKKYNINYVELIGSVEERLSIMVKTIQKG